MTPRKSASELRSRTSSELQEDYYVGVSEPLEVRRTMLETSKCIIQAMHRYEKYKEYREEKIDLIKKVNKQMTELGGLIASLKSVLPKSTLRIKKAREQILAQRSKEEKLLVSAAAPVVQKEVEAPRQIIKMTPKKELTELEKLELELSQIESKLSSLNK